MGLFQRFLFMMLMGGLLLYLLSLLPESRWEGGASFLPVYLMERETTEEELVHFLVQNSFAEKIKKVQLINNRLMIDLLSPSLPERKRVLQDLSRLIDQGFASLPLGEIWIRSLATRGGEEELVVGVIASRDQYRKGLWNDRMDEEDLLKALSEHYQLTYGLLWSRLNKKVE